MNELLLKMFILALAAASALTMLSGSFAVAGLGAGDSMTATFGLSLLAILVLVPIAYSIRARSAVGGLAFKSFQWRLLAICVVALVILPYYTSRNSADAAFYDGQAMVVADQIRAGEWQQIEINSGTPMVSFVTALLYLPFGPSAAGMTFLSGLLGFIGSLCFVGAAAESLPLKRLRQYTLFVTMLPSIVFWSTLFGKDSWVFFGLGIAALGTAQWLRNRRMGAMMRALLGLGIAFAFRPYVALAVLLSLALTMLISRTRVSSISTLKAVFLLVLLVPGAAFMWQGVSRITGVTDVSEQSIVGRISDQGIETKAGGGSDVETTQVKGTRAFITQLPVGAVRLFFRPFPWESTSIFMLMAALDNIVLIVVLVARRRNLMNTIRTIRTQPYGLFCLILTIGLTAVFSTISNLGLLMREKTQITPFLFFLAFSGDQTPPQRKTPEIQRDRVWLNRTAGLTPASTRHAAVSRVDAIRMASGPGK